MVICFLKFAKVRDFKQNCSFAVTLSLMSYGAGVVTGIFRKLKWVAIWVEFSLNDCGGLQPFLCTVRLQDFRYIPIAHQHCDSGTGLVV